MNFRFYIDPETDRPHVENHGVTSQECIEAIERSGQDYAGDDEARIAFGQTRAGRYLKIVFRLDEYMDECLIITAYPLKGNELKAYRRRIRRKR